MPVEPRASLGAELAGRLASGERPRPRPIRLPARRWLVGAAASAALLLTLAGARAGWVPSLDALARARTIDHCCRDLDGGHDADDGVLVESVAGERVRRLVVYEDRDGSGGWSPGDRVRFTRRGRPSVVSAAGSGLVTRQYCCVDYDGGGPSDDGVLVVGTATGDVLMAGIFEAGRAPAPAPLR